jgi:hypothetical protein
MTIFHGSDFSEDLGLYYFPSQNTIPEQAESL